MGLIKGARKIKKKFHGVELFTGDWLVTFEKLYKPIPSYVDVRGWTAYVKYDGQAQMCRKCHQSGHFFANCPKRNEDEAKPGKRPRNEDKEHTSEPENMDLHEPPPPNAPDLTEEEMRSTPTMQEENPELYKPPQEEPGYHDAYQEILENLEPPVNG